MICLYDSKEATFSDNGICVLDPSVCTVTEEAGGQYELYIEHPMDEYGKFNMLVENQIIVAPVPKNVVPAITLPATEILRVKNNNTDFWKKLPTYKRDKKTEDALDYIREHPSSYYWNPTKIYNYGDYCIWGSPESIYQAKGVSLNVQPTDTTKWGYIARLVKQSGEEVRPIAVPGVPWSPKLAADAVVTKIADYDSTYYQIKDSLGRIGYVAKSDVETVRTEAETIPSQTITKQRFRIYRVESDEESFTVQVYARHISYDFAANRILDCKITDAEPANAIAVMQGNLMESDTRRIACQFKGGQKITKNWSFKNPVNALLDPDEGLVSELKARLIRNNENFYILKNNNPRQGITIQYGINMVGVQWTRSSETIVTRVVPRCSSGNEEYLYLEHGGTWTNADLADEHWDESNNIYVEAYNAANRFPIPVIEVLDCQFAVGEKYTPPGSSTETTRTEASCREEMLKEAKKRFTDDHCDGLEVTLNVDFVLLGDTVQYSQYKGLQRVNLYDEITVKTKTATVTAQVTAYEYDCLLERYNSITVGNVSSFNKRVAGYRVVNESITYDKLSPDLINRIRTLGGEIGSGGGGGGETPSGGNSGSGESVTVNLNSKTQDGTVKKGSDAGGVKVWKTDSEGNPAWRSEEATVTVVDSDPTLAWNTRSKVGSVSGTDLHVTMPSDPSYTLPLAADGTRGGAQIGYTQSGKNYPVALDNEKMYVNVPWENDDTKNTAGTTQKAATKLFLAGATSQGANPQTYSNDLCYIGIDNNIYSNGYRTASIMSPGSAGSYQTDLCVSVANYLIAKGKPTGLIFGTVTGYTSFICMVVHNGDRREVFGAAYDAKYIFTFTILANNTVSNKHYASMS